MKKLLLSIAVGAAILTSCSSEEPAAAPTSDGNVTFTASIPGSFKSRAISDGTTATKLTYVVYNESGNEIEALTKTVDMADCKATINLNLVSGKKYTVVFWASAPDAPYTFNTADGTVTIKETGVSQDEKRDAFFATEEFEVTGAVEKTIELKRPFAQINVLTTDMAEFTALQGSISKAGLKVMAPTVLNLKDGSVSGEKEYSLSDAAFPDANESLPLSITGKTLTWLVADYILVGNSKETIDVTWTSDIGDPTRQSVTYTNVPVQRNYRTNIYGALLTTAYNFNVVLNPGDIEPGHDYTPVVVTNSDDFVETVSTGASALIPENVEIDIKDKDFIELQDGQSLTVQGKLNTKREQISVSGEGNVAYVNGGGTITSEGVADARGNRPLNVYDGATLIVKDVTVITEQNNGGSAIYSEYGNLDLENVTIKCHNFAIGATGGTLKVEKCDIYSDSNNKEGAWSYAVDVWYGCVATFDETTVTGIQGGISVGGEGSIVTINGGVYQTIVVEGKGDAFYPVYIYDKGVVIVNRGDFISGHSQKYTVFNGNNDVPEQYAWGNGCVLRGGRYNGPTIDQASQLAYPADEGYEWKAIEGDPVFKWEVVKKSAE